MPATRRASDCARRSSMAIPARCRRSWPRSPLPTASATAWVAPLNTRRPPSVRSTAWPTIRTWPRCAAWRATRSVAIADRLEPLLEEVVHHLLSAPRRQRVVDAARRALGVRQREAVHRVAEVHELPVDAGRVHFLLEPGDVAGGAAVVGAVEHQHTGLHRILLRRPFRRQTAMERHHAGNV